MKKKIKLRDLTLEQYGNYKMSVCNNPNYCSKCIFSNVVCSNFEKCWIHHKDLYSDKFLDQEVEIETPTFTDKEKEYLHNLLKPFKGRTIEIRVMGGLENGFAHLQFIMKSLLRREGQLECADLPYYVVGTMYKNLEVNKSYTDDELKELLRELELEE